MSKATEIMGRSRFEPKVWGSTPAQTLIVLDNDELGRLSCGQPIAVNLDRLGVPGGGVLEICYTSDPATRDRVRESSARSTGA